MKSQHTLKNHVGINIPCKCMYTNLEKNKRLFSNICILFRDRKSWKGGGEWHFHRWWKGCKGEARLRTLDLDKCLTLFTDIL